MKNIVLGIILLGFSSITTAQDYQSKFAEYCGSKDTTAQRKLLLEWEESNPNDPELFTSYFNYYFSLSKESMIGIDSKPKGEENLQIMDSTNKVMGFLVEQTLFNSDLLEKAFNSIDQGIKKFPKRLDMRFGKIYALGQIKNWETYTNEIILAVGYSNKIKNKWTWTNNEPVENSEEFFLGNIQGYQSNIYNTEDDALLKYMRKISEQVLKHYPNHVESLSNISITYLLNGEYDNALVPLLKAEKINPNDAIVLTNIAQAYKLKKDKTESIKYYKKAIEVGDDQTKEFAKQQIKTLEKQSD